jgi:hypothetical protein
LEQIRWKKQILALTFAIFSTKMFETFSVVPFSLSSGREEEEEAAHVRFFFPFSPLVLASLESRDTQSV